MRPRPANARAQKTAVLAGTALLMAAFSGAMVFLTSRRAAEEGSRARSTRQSAALIDSGAQREAERLLQQATGNNTAAAAQIEERAPAWRGRIQLTPQLKSLVGAGMNARDLGTRSAAIRLELAAMDIAEDDASVERLAMQADSNDHATRIWALWTLGLLANRGVEAERITGILSAHLSDQDVEARHWAVEGLAYAGNDEVIPLLLKAMHDDPSAMVRERAACSLAESGMLTLEQRRTAIPTLLTYADDPKLDAATHAWTFHALRDITGQSLPDDAAKWREWYEQSQR